MVALEKENLHYKISYFLRKRVERMEMIKITLQNLLETAEKVGNYTTHLRTINLRFHLTVLQKVYTVFWHKQV